MSREKNLFYYMQETLYYAYIKKFKIIFTLSTLDVVLFLCVMS